MIYKEFKNFTEGQSSTENIPSSAYIEIGCEKVFIERGSNYFSTTIQGKNPRFHNYKNEILTIGTALSAAINN